MGTKVIISKSCKSSKNILPRDYPRLMVGKDGRSHENKIFFMISHGRGICLTNHGESYYGIQKGLRDLEDFEGSIKIFNAH